jgi:GDSL-like Lipase/Acylhydrolase family
MSKKLLLGSILATVAALLVPQSAAVAAPPTPRSTAPPGPPAAEPDRSTVEPVRRDQVLPPGWRSSDDVLWTTDGDATGFHLLVAEARTGYTWRTAATLSEPWVAADRWVGNACLTGSGRRAVVVYAPRHFTNRAHLFDRGAFAAVVDLTTGAVSKLDITVSLAYHNPGCGTGETAVLTQSGVVDRGRTRLNVVDTVRPRVLRSHELTGEITSSVPVGDAVVAASGAQLVRISTTGATSRLVRTGTVPYRVHPDAGGGIVFTERTGGTGVVQRLTGSTVRELARGPLTGIRVVPGTAGRLFLTGSPSRVGALPAAVRVLTAPVGSEVSTTGAATITRVDQKRTAATALEPDRPREIRLRARVAGTGATVDFATTPAARVAPAAVRQGSAVSPAAPAGTAPRGPVTAAESPTDPVDQDRTCAVERNNVRLQVYQPHWSQVEWAANLAVQHALTVTRPANWKQSGMASSWSPQTMFPPVALAGGGRVPAQILLGVLAQESNLWQASMHVGEGVTGNPLIGDYYGVRDGWGINWATSDCGYGVAQVTDGMRRGAMAADKQRAVAVDYATNIAAGAQILQQKWNQTYNAGMHVVGGAPDRIESWFTALWAYNSGINPQASTGNTSGCTPSPTCTDAQGNWGLGWTNNPIRPDFPPDRAAFLDHDHYEDAKNPQWWPYPEKVIGWAGFPIVKSTGGDGYEAGYKWAWWNTAEIRSGAKPPIETFCVLNATTGNRCNPDNVGPGPNPCTLADFHCWWHSAAAWKDCSPGRPNAPCGHEADVITAPGTPEPPDADAPGAYPDETRTRWSPNCSTSGLPAGALVVDNLPDTVPIVRSNCPRNWTNSGSFGLAFNQHTDGLYHSKVDFHQIGGGFGGHLWFARTYPTTQEATRNRRVTGTWTLGRTVNQWARVLVHVPDHHAHTQQAPYTIHLGDGGTRTRLLPQKTRANKWVALGAFPFAGTPKVALTNINAGGDGTEDIAFDAVAFQLLPGKPAEQLVVLGDSYSSGEGAGDYLRESADDGHNGPAYRNGCHRSRNAWSRQAVLPGSTESVATRADNFRPDLDYHLLACSGAETENLLPAGSGVRNGFNETGRGQFREVSQLDRGYLDDDTTTVALTIGGNDAHFSDVMRICTAETPSPIDNCDAAPAPWAPPYSLGTVIPGLINGPVKQSIETVAREIRAKAPNARIVLMGYPHLFPPSGSHCLTLGLSPFDIEWLNHMGDMLNWAIHETVVTLSKAGFNIAYSDPRDEFELENACSRVDATPETIHRVVLDKAAGEDPAALVSAQSFHPKASGALNYADSYVATLIGLQPGRRLPIPISKEVARAELDFIQRVLSRPGSSGYRRADWEHWISNAMPGCTTREVVLRRDNATADPNCKATTGQWVSPYDSTAHTTPGTLEIDHVVPLKEAHLSGGAGWTPAMRRLFANDLEHPQLLAVTSGVNSSKAERPPDVWLPGVSYLCDYARAWIHVKAMYRLGVSQAEYATLTEILTTRC